MRHRFSLLAVLIFVSACSEEESGGSGGGGGTGGGGGALEAGGDGPQCLDDHTEIRPGKNWDCGGHYCLPGLGCESTCEVTADCRPGYVCEVFGGTGKGCAVSAPPNDF